MSSRWVHVANGALALALAGGSALVWSGLPEQLPIHFGVSGLPDGFADTTLLTWFGLPVLAFLVGAGLYLLAAVLPMRPGWINLRDRKGFLALPEPARRPVYERVQFVTYLSVTFLLVILDMVQLAVYFEARGSSAQSLVIAVLGVAAAGSLVISTLAIVGMQRAMDESRRLGKGL